MNKIFFLVTDTLTDVHKHAHETFLTNAVLKILKLTLDIYISQVYYP